jgi:hypothetical protein
MADRETHNPTAEYSRGDYLVLACPRLRRTRQLLLESHPELTHLRIIAPSPRVRHQSRARSNHQDGLAPGALGCARGRRSLPGRHLAAARLPSHRRRRGKNKARVAVARKLLTLVYYGLRGGEIRCVADHQAA